MMAELSCQIPPKEFLTTVWLFLEIVQNNHRMHDTLL